MEHGEEVLVKQLAGGGGQDHLALAQPVVGGDQSADLRRQEQAVLGVLSLMVWSLVLARSAVRCRRP